MIELESVIKTFGKKDNVFIALKDISLSIPEGQTVAITGKSGSGKSTLMHVMSGLDHASEGVVRVNGKELRKMSAKQIDKFRARDMGFIFQSFFVEAKQSCYDNVMLPLEIAETPRSKRKKLAQDALEAVELDEKIGEKARNLSGGQKQRLAVARAIVNKPKIIFADEPTGNLDSATGEKVMQLLFDMNKKLGSTLIIVTHDEELASRCSMQVKIHDGDIVDRPKAKSKKGKK